MSWQGEEPLMAALADVDPVYRKQLEAVLQGGEEAEMLAAMQAMHLPSTEAGDASAQAPP